MRCPLKNTSPDVGVRKPPIIRNVVVFPHQLGPSNVRNSLLLMYRLIPSRTVTPSSNVMERFDKRMSFSDIYHPPFRYKFVHRKYAQAVPQRALREIYMESPPLSIKILKNSDKIYDKEGGIFRKNIQTRNPPRKPDRFFRSSRIRCRNPW